MRYRVVTLIFYYLYIFLRVSMYSINGMNVDVYRILGFQNSLIYILYIIVLYNELKVSNIFLYKCKNRKEYERSVFKIMLPVIILYLTQIEVILLMFSISHFNVIHILQHILFTFINLSLCTYTIIVLKLYIKEYIAYLILIIFIIASRVMDLFSVKSFSFYTLNFANFGSMDVYNNIIYVIGVYVSIIVGLLILRWYKRNDDLEI